MATTLPTMYDLIWSPEGRRIATVTARSEYAARRQAPLPYRRTRSEIAAVRTLTVPTCTVIYHANGVQQVDLDAQRTPIQALPRLPLTGKPYRTHRGTHYVVRAVIDHRPTPTAV